MRFGLRLLYVAGYALLQTYSDAGQCELTPQQTCKLKIGLVGGGSSLWTAIHNMSVNIGDTRRIVAGAMNSKPEKALETARNAGIVGYKHWKDMLDAWRKGEQDLDYVLILSRNKDHYEPLKAFVSAGLPVFCERPLTMTVEEAEDVQKIAEAKNVPLIVGHTFTGHPMLMHAKEIVRGGHLGEVRKVESWYNQDWAALNTGYSWRFDPAVAGMAGAAADVGMQTYAAATWVSGLSLKRVTARLKSFSSERELDETYNVLAELENGGIAVMLGSTISIGYKNEHGLRIFGSKASLEWNLATPKVLVVRTLPGATLVLDFDRNRTQLPPVIASYGIDFALANLHTTMERIVREKKGEKALKHFNHPGVQDGVNAMRFLEAVAASSKNDGAWTDVPRAAKGRWF